MVGCGLVVLLLIGVIAFGFTSCMKGGDKRTEAEAMIACKDAIKAQLKDPSSADIEWRNTIEREKTDTSQQFELTGVVRATNSFGATVPTAFACTATTFKDRDAVAKVALV